MTTYRYHDALDDMLWRLKAMLDDHTPFTWPDACTYANWTLAERVEFLDEVHEAILRHKSDRMAWLESENSRLESENSQLQRGERGSKESDTGWCVVESEST